MSSSLSSHHAVYVGSFDPLTLGHVDIIKRGAVIFDKITVGIGINPDKRPLFTPEERLALAQSVLSPFKNVELRCFEGLTVEFIRQCGARVLLRGRTHALGYRIGIYIYTGQSGSRSRNRHNLPDGE